LRNLGHGLSLYAAAQNPDATAASRKFREQRAFDRASDGALFHHKTARYYHRLFATT
jgi:hypothetical protein